MLDQIWECQKSNQELAREFQRLEKDEASEFKLWGDYILEFRGWIYVFKTPNFQRVILEEANSSTYFVHPRNTKIYYTIKEDYWWSWMKHDIIEFVVKCLVCQQVKAEY